MTVEQLQAELDKTRREAARYRTERNQYKPLAQKYQEAEDANKTEAQKAAERIAALEAENQQMALASKRAELVADSGVPVELLRGSTVEELTEHAAALKEAFAQASTNNTPPADVVVAGENSGGAPLQEADWLRKQLLGK
ncbi:MAG: hypothetical protein Q4G50_10875 [Corynebacterium sp.]|uniref:hypothetical protein n=1 Tax=Corynebacterium sp. TaxID=1720 RepID=UPI0026DEB7D9|nr:hypothetical protein [Corynebacterium sp.]MDO5670496.1 hypothetical protein [Corynebacterium sp.]